MIALDRIRQQAGSILIVVLMTVALLGFTALPLLVYQPPETDPSRLEPVNPMKPEEFGKAEFVPAKLAAMLPEIRISACLFSEKAVRHYVRPGQVGLPSCGGHEVQVTIADNLIDITVSGVATIEKIGRPFTVVLQHNPPSVTEDGLIVTAINVDQR